MPLVSIIIPIYNTEKYLRECIESILNQDMRDFELILVNDGSTDGCAQICEEYKNKDDRIIFVTKDNGGVSDARNMGINIAKGKYLIFCDSDDTMVSGALKKTVLYAEKHMCDITMCTYILDYEDGSVPETENINFDEEKYNDMCETISAYMKDIVPWSACRNIIRRELAENNGIRYNGEFYCAEDCDFYFNICKYSSRFGSINQPIIRYRAARENSTSNTYNKRNVESISKVYDKWIRFFKHNYGKHADGIMTALSEHYYYLVIEVLKSGDKELIGICDRYKSVLRYVKGRKKKAVRAFYNIFGVGKGIILFRGK